MDKLSGKTTRSASFLLLYIIITIVSIEILSVVGDGGHRIAPEMQEKPLFTKMVKDTLSSFKKSHKNYWGKIKSAIHQVQLQFFPPDLDFRRQVPKANSKRGAKDKVGAGEKVKEAAEKSIEASKVAAEESAKSAAKVVGAAVHKVKDKVSDDNKSSHDEL